MSDERMGVYVLLNKVTGKVYVGSSTKLLARRREHLWALNGVHPHPDIHLDARMYGITSFKWLVMEWVDDERLLRAAEQRWLDYFLETDASKVYNREHRVKRSDVVVRGRSLAAALAVAADDQGSGRV